MSLSKKMHFIRITDENYQAIVNLAKEEERSITKVTNRLLRKALSNDKS